MSAQRKLKENYEASLVVEKVGGEPYEYLPLGEYVVAARGVCGGRPTIKYHRLDARHIMSFINGGQSPRRIARLYKIPVAAVEEVVKLAKLYDYEASYV